MTTSYVWDDFADTQLGRASAIPAAPVVSDRKVRRLSAEFAIESVSLITMENAVFHYSPNALPILQNPDIGQWIAVDQDHVGQIAFFDFSQLIRPTHDRATQRGGRENRLHRRKAEEIDEILQIFGVGAVRRPGETVISARQNANAARLHFLDG